MKVKISFDIKDLVNDLIHRKRSMKQVEESDISFGLHDKDSLGVPKITPDNSSNLDLKTVAYDHEFGLGKNTPQRSFIRSTFDENRNKYVNLVKKEVNNLIETSDVNNYEHGLQMIASEGVDDIVTKIESGISPPLSNKTKAIKSIFTGRSVDIPLIWTGQLIDEIKPKVTIK